MCVAQSATLRAILALAKPSCPAVAVETAEDLSGELKPGLQRHITRIRGLAADEVEETFDATAQLVGCPRVNEAYFEWKSAFCCEFVAMLYWLAVSSVVTGCSGCCAVCGLGWTHRSLKPKPEGDAPPQMPMEPEFDGIDKRISGGDTPRDGTPRRKPPPRSAGTPRRDS